MTAATPTRRAALGAIAAVLAGVPGLVPGLGRATAMPGGRAIALHRAGVEGTLWLAADGRPVDGLGALCRFLGDPRNGEAAPHDPSLTAMIAALHAAAARMLGRSPAIEIVEAYRSPGAAGEPALPEDAASLALHGRGRAVDLRLLDCPRAALRPAVAAVPGGGAGVYLASGIVHLDSGPWRRWSRSLR